MYDIILLVYLCVLYMYMCRRLLNVWKKFFNLFLSIMITRAPRGVYEPSVMMTAGLIICRGCFAPIKLTRHQYM